MQTKTNTFPTFWVFLFAFCYMLSFPFVIIHYLLGNTWIITEVILGLLFLHISYAIYENERELQVKKSVQEHEPKKEFYQGTIIQLPTSSHKPKNYKLKAGIKKERIEVARKLKKRRFHIHRDGVKL